MPHISYEKVIIGVLDSHLEVMFFSSSKASDRAYRLMLFIVNVIVIETVSLNCG